MLQTRIKVKYCRLKHQEVTIVEECPLEFNAEHDESWKLKKCSLRDEECYHRGCQRRQFIKHVQW